MDAGEVGLPKMAEDPFGSRRLVAVVGLAVDGVWDVGVDDV